MLQHVDSEAVGDAGGPRRLLRGRKHHRFAKSTTRKGILPEILSELLSARKIAKKAMKKAKDPFTKSIQNGRQLALKIACNSIYGFTGVGKGYLPCWPIAATTTTIGRQMIEDSKRISEEAFPAAQCIYGDSVSGKTPLLLRIDGEVRILPIEKVELTDEHSVYTWTEKGWTRIERVICHKLAEHKKMLRVTTHSGIVDCTDDHSLLTESGMPISPDDVEVGVTELLHSYPMEFGSLPFHAVRAPGEDAGRRLLSWTRAHGGAVRGAERIGGGATGVSRAGNVGPD